MRSKKGFTLLELLAILVIIGMLLALAIPSVHKYLKMGIGSYYTNLENSVTLAGKDYLTDFRTLLPKEIGNVRVIDFEELVKNKYIDPIKDSDGNLCEGKVVAKKVDKNNYEYYTCIRCGENGETYTSDICEEVDNSSEDNNITPDTNDYDIRLVDDNPSFTVCQADSFTIPKVKILHKNNNGEWEETTEEATVSPKKIDTNSLGTKKLIYSYKGKTLEKDVVVVDCSNPSKPQIVLRYDNSMGNLYDGRWYNGNIYQEFLSLDYINGFTGSGIDYYEISTDGGKSYTKIDGNSKLDKENGNYTYYVRAVDKMGKSGEAISYNLKIDKDKPECTIVVSGEKGNNGWYISPVTISFDPNKTKDKPDNANSGIKSYYLGSNPNYGTGTSSLVISQNTDNNGFTVNDKVTDNANNENTSCNFVDSDGNPIPTPPTIKIDTTKSSDLGKNLKITASDGIASGEWHNKDVTLSVTSDDTSSSGLYYYIDTNPNPSTQRDEVTINSNTTSTTYYAKVCNGAGVCSDKISYELKIDKDKPECTIVVSGEKGNNGWYISPVTISFDPNKTKDKPDNANSGIKSYYLGSNPNYGTGTSSLVISQNTDNNGFTVNDKVTDNANNENTSCNFVDSDGNPIPIPPSIKIDTTKSSDLGKNLKITASDGIASGEWHNKDVTLSVTSDATSSSGLYYYIDTNPNPSTQRDKVTINSNTTSTTYYAKVCNGAGVCSDVVSYILNFDNEAPTCELEVKSGILGENNWYTSNVTIGFKSTDGTGSEIQNATIEGSSGKDTVIISDDTTTAGNTIKATVTDRAGNTNSCSITVKVDKTRPIISYSPIGGNDSSEAVSVNKNQTVTITASDTNFDRLVVTVYHRPNRGNDTGITKEIETITDTKTYSVTLDKDGEWLIYTKAYDEAGNEQSQSPENDAGWYYQSYWVTSKTDVSVCAAYDEYFKNNNGFLANGNSAPYVYRCEPCNLWTLEGEAACNCAIVSREQWNHEVAVMENHEFVEEKSESMCSDEDVSIGKVWAECHYRPWYGVYYILKNIDSSTSDCSNANISFNVKFVRYTDKDGEPAPEGGDNGWGFADSYARVQYFSGEDTVVNFRSPTYQTEFLKKSTFFSCVDEECTSLENDLGDGEYAYFGPFSTGNFKYYPYTDNIFDRGGGNYGKVGYIRPGETGDTVKVTIPLTSGDLIFISDFSDAEFQLTDFEVVKK